jgi:hypothetical protein
MTHEPTDTAQIKLRVRKELRLKLEAEAQRRRVNLTTEMVRRLEASFAEKPLVDLASAARDVGFVVTQLETAWSRLAATQETLALINLVLVEIDTLIGMENRGDETPEKFRARTERIRGLAWPVQRLRDLRKAVEQEFREAILPRERQS